MTNINQYTVQDVANLFSMLAVDIINHANNIKSYKFIRKEYNHDIVLEHVLNFYKKVLNVTETPIDGSATLCGKITYKWYKNAEKYNIHIKFYKSENNKLSETPISYISTMDF